MTMMIILREEMVRQEAARSEALKGDAEKISEGSRIEQERWPPLQCTSKDTCTPFLK